jgi:hypothetical protein
VISTRIEVVGGQDEPIARLVRVPGFGALAEDERTVLRNDIVALWERHRGDENQSRGLNFPIVGPAANAVERLYGRLVEVAEATIPGFRMAAESVVGGFAYCIDRTSPLGNWHHHRRTAHVNAVYYLAMPPDPGQGQLFFRNGDRIAGIRPEQDELVVFSPLLEHRPLPVDTSEPRISINMELLATDPTACQRFFALD